MKTWLLKYYRRKRLDPYWVIGITMLLMFCLIMFIVIGESESAIDLDRWADAIFKAEGGYSATYLYGIRSIPYETEEQARRYCKNTVYNTLVKYRSTRCKPTDDDATCIARRYCPVGSDTDNGTCQYWKKNVLHFYNKGE